MSLCPYCKKRVDVDIAAENSRVYSGIKLVAASCCKQPLLVYSVSRTVIEKAVTEREEDDWGEPFAKPIPKLDLKPWQEVIYSVGDDRIATRIKCVEAFQHDGHDLYRIALEHGFEATFYQDSEKVLSDTMFGYGNGVNKILI